MYKSRLFILSLWYYNPHFWWFCYAQKFVWDWSYHQNQWRILIGFNYFRSFHCWVCKKFSYTKDKLENCDDGGRRSGELFVDILHLWGKQVARSRRRKNVMRKSLDLGDNNSYSSFHFIPLWFFFLYLFPSFIRLSTFLWIVSLHFPLYYHRENNFYYIIYICTSCQWWIFTNNTVEVFILYRYISREISDIIP